MGALTSIAYYTIWPYFLYFDLPFSSTTSIGWIDGDLQVISLILDLCLEPILMISGDLVGSDYQALTGFLVNINNLQYFRETMFLR